MATTKQTTSYRSGIQKSDKEIESEQIDFTVESANIELQKGILDIQSKVKEAEMQLSTTKKHLESAKYAKVFSCQSLVDNYQAVKSAELYLESAQDVLQFFESTHKELFGSEK